MDQSGGDLSSSALQKLFHVCIEYSSLLWTDKERVDPESFKAVH